MTTIFTTFFFQTFSDEVKEKPNDATINAKLLNFYIDNGRFREAYDLAFKKKIGFVPNLFWYQSCVQICKVDSYYSIFFHFFCLKSMSV